MMGGLLVLGGPIVLFLLLIPLAFWIAVKVSRRFRPGFVRFLGGGAVFLFLIFLPRADELLGRAYHGYLCATQAGVKVYQTVELPREYWDEEGRARFIKREGSLDFDESMLGNQFLRRSSSQSYFTLLNINRDSYQLVARSAQSVIGENVNFRFWGGWVVRNLSPNKSAIGCNRDQAGYFTDVLKNVFKPTSANK